MEPSHPREQRNSCRSPRFGVRWLLSAVLSLAMLLGQVVPGTAGHSTSSSGGWVEICSDGGIRLVELDEDGQEKAPESDHCVLCLIPVSELQDADVALQSSLAITEFTVISYQTDQADVPDGPEQYWSACRGPPIASSEKNMTTLASLSNKEPAGSATYTWSNPCV